jgi:hypothetical protein
MRAAGQAVLLVTDGPNLVANFCTRGGVLERGRKVFDGVTPDAIAHYKQIRTELLDDETVQSRNVRLPGTGIQLEPTVLLQAIEAKVPKNDDEPMLVRATLKALRDMHGATLNFGIRNHEGIVVSSVDGLRAGIRLPNAAAGELVDLTCAVDNRLTSGRYFFTLLVSVQVGDVSRPIGLFQNVLQLDIVRPNDAHGGLVNLGLQIESSLRKQTPQ